MTMNFHRTGTQGATIVTLEQIREIRKEAELSRTRSGKEGTLISKVDYDRMKQAINLPTKDEIEARRIMLSEQLRESKSVERSRRDRIILAD